MNPGLLGKLVCPLTRTPLRYDEVAQELVSEAARRSCWSRKRGA